MTIMSYGWLPAVHFQLVGTKRTEDAASQVQMYVEHYCKTPEIKGLAIRGKQNEPTTEVNSRNAGRLF